MLEHLFNCHGEWQALFAMAGSLPFVGYWFKAKFYHKHVEDCDESG